jgi:hypothetical protein
MLISSLMGAHEKVEANESDGWKPNIDCSARQNTWSRLGNIRFSSYVSGYHHANSDICATTRASSVSRQGTRR